MARDKVLIVEDKRSLTDVLVYNLEREGYEVFVAHDGRDWCPACWKAAEVAAGTHGRPGGAGAES